MKISEIVYYKMNFMETKRKKGNKTIIQKECWIIWLGVSEGVNAINK